MFRISNRSLKFALSGFIAAVLSCVAHAQPKTYPDRPIRLIVGFVAGGPSDILARVIAKEMNASLGQPVVVDNLAGADANIAMDAVARSEPDGYTLLLAQSGMAINPALYRTFKWRPSNFTPVGLIGEAPNVVVVNSDLPVRSIKELIAHARTHPSGLNYASTSSPTRLATDLFNNMAGITMTMIPYRGTPPAVTDLHSNNVQVLISSVSTMNQYRSDRNLRFLATTGSKRSGLMADLPTVAESGVPGYDAVTWYGLAGPARLPPETSAKLEAALNDALDKPSVRDQLRSLGVDGKRRTPAEFAAFVNAELARWADVVAKSGSKID